MQCISARLAVGGHFSQRQARFAVWILCHRLLSGRLIGVQSTCIIFWLLFIFILRFYFLYYISHTLPACIYCTQHFRWQLEHVDHPPYGYGVALFGF